MPFSGPRQQARYHLRSFLCMQPSFNCLKMFIIRGNKDIHPSCPLNNSQPKLILILDIRELVWVPITKELLSNSVFVFSKWPVLIIKRSGYPPPPPSAQMLLTLKLNLKQKMDSSAIISLASDRQHQWADVSCNRLTWHTDNRLFRKPPLLLQSESTNFMLLLLLLWSVTKWHNRLT